MEENKTTTAAQEQQPADHVEQRGFACAVAAQQAVNFSRFQG